MYIPIKTLYHYFHVTKNNYIEQRSLIQPIAIRIAIVVTHRLLNYEAAGGCWWAVYSSDGNTSLILFTAHDGSTTCLYRPR